MTNDVAIHNFWIANNYSKMNVGQLSVQAAKDHIRGALIAKRDRLKRWWL